MKEDIVIVGAGGHSLVCAEIAKLVGYKNIIFLDDSPNALVDVSGTTENLPLFIDKYDIFVAIGDNSVRESFIKKIISLNGTLATLVHPKSVVSETAEIGVGTVVMAGTVINPKVVVGKGVIVNTCSSVDHNSHLKNYCHISVGAHLAGNVVIGERTFVGAGSTVINNIKIHSDTIIGAGAVVVSEIEEKGTFIGVPARRIK